MYVVDVESSDMPKNSINLTLGKFKKLEKFYSCFSQSCESTLGGGRAVQEGES